MTEIVLSDGAVRCAVAPEAGGRIAAITVGGTDLLVPGAPDDPAMTWGSFPMVPWAGRVRRARLLFDGATHALPVGLAPHAIHGTAYLRPWTVTSSDATSVSLRTDLGDDWPFGGWVEQRITVTESTVRCDLVVTAADRRMPAQVGWHPWFRKPTSARLRFGGMYRRDVDGIPDGEIVTPPAGPWDDCFVRPLGAPSLVITGRGGAIEVVIDSDCDHWVVYDRPDAATCVEPQSGPPDGLNTAPDVLEPGHSLSRHMTLTLSSATRSQPPLADLEK